VAAVLLEHGASPSAPGELGSLPLAIAARTGNVAMATLLLAAGADLNKGEVKTEVILIFFIIIIFLLFFLTFEFLGRSVCLYIKTVNFVALFSKTLPNSI
jgi:ankyrin repeat protein